MIMTEIFIPALNQTRDFKLDENAYIADVLMDIGELLLPEDEVSEEAMAGLLLCSYEQRRIYPLDRTLRQEGVENGDRLVLV